MATALDPLLAPDACGRVPCAGAAPARKRPHRGDLECRERCGISKGACPARQQAERSGVSGSRVLNDTITGRKSMGELGPERGAAPGEIGGKGGSLRVFAETSDRNSLGQRPH